MTAIGYLWATIFAAAWLSVSVLMIKTAWTGQFWFWRISPAGLRWPPLRSEHPVCFWLVWTGLALPFLILPLLILLGSQ